MPRSRCSTAPDKPACSSGPTTDGRRPTTFLLCYVTDRKQLAGDEPARCARLLELIAAAARAGVDFIQLREKDLPTRELERLATLARQAVEPARAAGSASRLLINSRCDVAIACGCDGVHLRAGADELAPAEARALFEKAGSAHAVIGVSCHTPAEIARAAAQGVDFAVFGPVFGKGPDAAHERIQPVGVTALHAACAASTGGMPVLAIGAVTLENARECLRAGAAGVAGIRLFQMADAAQQTRALRLLPH